MSVPKEQMRAQLFGVPSPEEVRYARTQQLRGRGMEAAAMPPGRGQVAAASIAGDMIGGGLAGLAGYQDPMEQKARLIQEAQQEVQQSGVDIFADPGSYYKAAAEALSKRGLEAEAMQAYQLFREEQYNAAQIGIEREDAITRRIAAEAARTTANRPQKEELDNFSKLVRNYQAGHLGDPESDEAKERFSQAWKALTDKKAPSTVVNLPPGEDTFLKEMAKHRSVAINELHDSAEHATTDMLFNSQRIAEILDEENLIVGPGADFRFAFAKGLNILGANNDETIANTQQLVAGLSNNTLSAIKTSGLGTGQGFTDKDLRFLNDAKSGSISFTKKAMAELVRINTTVARNIVQKWNDQLDIFPADQKQQLSRLGFDMNPRPLPEIIDLTGKYKDEPQPKAAAGTQDNPIPVKSKEEVQKLPSGTYVVKPDGSVGIVP